LKPHQKKEEKMKRWKALSVTSIIACLLLVFSVVLFVDTATAKEYRIKFATTSARSGYYAFNVAKAKAVHEVFPEIEVTVVETGGTVENLELLRKGMVEWAAHTNMATGAAAYHGILDYKGRGFPELRQLWAPIMQPITLFVTEASGIKDITGLTGKKFGRRSGAADGRIIEYFMDGNGIKPNWMRAKAGALTDATKGRSIIGWGKAGKPEAAILEIAAVMPIKILAVTQEQIDKANKQFPGQFLGGIIPAGTYPGQEKDVYTLAFTVGDGCRKDMPEELAYKLTKAVYTKCDEIAASYGKNTEAWKKENNPAQKSLDQTVSPLHPGAIRYYREIGLTVPDSLIPPEMK
jgi:TRAP transporter TAXI family solute receptor